MDAATTSEAHAEVIDVIDPLRRYVNARIRSGQDADDVVQETLAKVISSLGRLTPGSALGYSIVVARHLMIDQAADSDRTRRAAPRLFERLQPQRPDDLVLRLEEQAALKKALAGVPSPQREAFLAHVLRDEPVATIASGSGASSGSVGAQLARTRARLRVDYVLALRGVELPTERCRPVLLALSAGDTRRQETLRAGHHLLTCSTCSSVSEPLLRRRSALAAILPWLGLGPAIAIVRRILSNSPGQAAVAATAVTTVGAVTLVAVLHGSGDPGANAATGPHPGPGTHPTPLPSASASARTSHPGPDELVRSSDGLSLLPVPATLATMAGDRVEARSVPVYAVDADEGFWIGDARRGRIWVQMITFGRESPFVVRTGDKVSFTGKIVTQPSDFGRREGVIGSEGAALLARQDAHLSVNEHVVRLSR